MKILISAVGDTDPIRNFHDGPLLHIVRVYRPEKIVLVHSERSLTKHDKLVKALKSIKDYSPEIIQDGGVLPDAQVAIFDKMYDTVSSNNKKYISDDEIILNIESFKGEDGKDGKDGAKGEDGKDGAKGKDGKDGIGIKDITEKNGEIVITLTDGTIKKLKMPRDIRVISGGGGSKGGGVSYYSNLNPTPYKVGGIEAGASFDNVEITKMFDMLLYPFEISLSVTPNKAQLGDTLNSILLKFETNGASESNINGIDVTGLDELIYPEPVSENKIFTLTAKKDNQTKTKQVSIQFLNNIYWGATSNPNPTNAEILASNKQLSNSKSKSVVYDCSGGKRYFIAYPKRLGSVTLSVNGFPNNNFTQIQRAFTNEFGYIEDYFICYGNTIVFGSDIPAVWS